MAKRGGKRAGAGRKPGVRAHNLEALSTTSIEAQRSLKEEFGIDPRAFLAAVMNRKNLPLDRRMRAAEILMPFAFPKLSATAVVSQRIEGNNPESIIRAINDRITRVTSAVTIDAVPSADALVEG